MAAPTTRKTPMEVLVLSLPRTGTRSMYESLRILLKQDVYHGYEMHDNKPPGRFWLDCVEAKFDRGQPPGRKELDVGLGNYAATTDMPCCFFWRELMEAYPEAKVVLVSRDFESWWRSFRGAILFQLYNPLTWVAMLLEPVMGISIVRMCRRVVLDYFEVPSSSQLTKQRARTIFDQHYAEIRKACEGTPGRLLEMQIADGWEPLCKHIGKEIPDVPFPRSNDAESANKISGGARTKLFVQSSFAVLKFVSPFAVVGGAVLWYFWI